MVFRDLRIFFTCLTVLASQSLAAQNAWIKGRVTDSSSPLPFAAITLKHTADTSYVQQVWADSLGYYELRVTIGGKYFIKVGHLGYQDFISDTIQVDTGSKTFMINLSRNEDMAQLKEVTVHSQKRVFETGKGKMIFHVQHSALTAGQTALDMLKQLPGVSMGQEEQVLFRGSAGINVMMDGKMTYLTGSQLINYLKGMSAEDIQKIELITTPSAEYDAAGNTGMINIVAKKNLKKGYAVDLRSSVSKGKYWMTNQNISANLLTKKVNLYGSFDYNTPHTFLNGKSGNTIQDKGNTVTLIRENENAFKTSYYTWHGEADWQFLPRHKIGASYHGYFDDWKGSKHSAVNKLNGQGGLQSYVHTDNIMIEPYHYDALSMNYQYQIDSSGKKITADANHTSYRNFSDGWMTSRNYAPNGNYLSENRLKISQPGSVKIMAAKADADLPFTSFSVKAGLKYAEVENDNRFRYDSLRSGQAIEIASLSNHFTYRERIAAAYLSGAKQFKKTSVEAGLRVEYTHADGYTVKQGIANKWEYTKLFPSFSVTQVINDDNKVDFSFSRRINRPAYTDLNPVRWYNDPYFYYSGNPALVPELAWVYVLTYSLKSKYIFSAAYNQSINYIDRRLAIDDNGVTIKSQSHNFGKRQRLDLTTSIPFRISRCWNVQFFSGLNYTSYPVSVLAGEKRVALWAINAALQQDISLPKDFMINLAANWFSAELRGIYKTKPAGFLNVGIKRSFFDKKMIAQLTVSDLLNTNRYAASSRTDIANYYYNDKPYSRIIGLSLKYHFGGDLIKSGNKKTEEQARL